jgi:hypothetical protein
MTLGRRIARLEAQPHLPEQTHTPPVIFYETDEQIPDLMTRATVCTFCMVHVVLRRKGSR